MIKDGYSADTFRNSGVMNDCADFCFAAILQGVSQANCDDVIYIKAGICVNDQGYLNISLNVNVLLASLAMLETYLRQYWLENQ